MALFKNQTHQDIWIESNCGQCWFGSRNCTILAWALGHGRKPAEWDRNTRKNVLMSETIRCKAKTKIAPGVRREKRFEDEPMFDVAPPVDMDTEHA